jgi:hypothetical protein
MKMIEHICLFWLILLCFPAYSQNKEYFDMTFKDSEIDNKFTFIEHKFNSYYEIPNRINDKILIKFFDSKNITLEKIFYLTGDRHTYLVIGNLLGSKQGVIIFIKDNRLVSSKTLPGIDSLKKEIRFQKSIITTFHYYGDMCSENLSKNIFVFDSFKLSEPLNLLIREIFSEEDNVLCKKGKNKLMITKFDENLNRIKMFSLDKNKKQTQKKIYVFDLKKFCWHREFKK